jgi:pimeloyl-ACP methyl ester carboxylesterase
VRTTVETRHGRLALSREGEGPALVLLHGVPGSAASWCEVAARLGPEVDLVVPDLLGFGGSAKPQELRALHARSQAEALLDALDQLELPTATVVGHDFGGPIALSLLAMAPERVSGLGLLATNAFPDTPIPLPLSTIFWPVVGRLAAAALFSRPSLRLMLRTGVGSPKVRLDPDAHLGDAAKVRTIRTVFEGSLRHLDELYGPVQAALEAADVPGFVLWGDRDRSSRSSRASGRRQPSGCRSPGSAERATSSPWSGRTKWCRRSGSWSARCRSARRGEAAGRTSLHPA